MFLSYYPNKKIKGEECLSIDLEQPLWDDIFSIILSYLNVTKLCMLRRVSKFFLRIIKERVKVEHWYDIDFQCFFLKDNAGLVEVKKMYGEDFEYNPDIQKWILSYFKFKKLCISSVFDVDISTSFKELPNITKFLTHLYDQKYLTSLKLKSIQWFSIRKFVNFINESKNLKRLIISIIPKSKNYYCKDCYEHLTKLKPLKYLRLSYFTFYDEMYQKYFDQLQVDELCLESCWINQELSFRNLNVKKVHFKLKKVNGFSIDNIRIAHYFKKIIFSIHIKKVKFSFHSKDLYTFPLHSISGILDNKNSIKQLKIVIKGDKHGKDFSHNLTNYLIDGLNEKNFEFKKNSRRFNGKFVTKYVFIIKKN